MKQDKIKRIEIDAEGKMLIHPLKSRFPMIYRSAAEVHWDADKNAVYSPAPREWTYLKWFKHIVDLIEKEADIQLHLTDQTEWVNIPTDLKNAILEEKKTKHNNI
ncbi:hypothetical protein [Pontibacter saemangeumensis]